MDARLQCGSISALCYTEGAACKQDSLCRSVSYDHTMLDLLPQGIIDKDYGCGDPSLYVRPGDTVVDLGSGGGKSCYIAAQIVGASGHVIAIDITDEMLELAPRYQGEMAEKLGYRNVSFDKGSIQDVGDIVGASSTDIVCEERVPDAMTGAEAGSSGCC